MTPDQITLAILVSARALISEPERWTQGASVRDAHGRPAGRVDSSCARRWCAVGAISAVSEIWRLQLSSSEMALIELENVDPIGSGVSTYNDTHVHSSVLNLFDQAIATVRRRVEG